MTKHSYIATDVNINNLIEVRSRTNILTLKNPAGKSRDTVIPITPPSRPELEVLWRQVRNKKAVPQFWATFNGEFWAPL